MTVCTDRLQGIWHRALAAACLCAAAVCLAGTAQAAGPADGDWSSLPAAQRLILEPLQTQWTELAPVQRQQWLEVAGRFASMPPAEQTRAQERMRAWARLTPAERGQVRLQFHEAQRWTPQERQERWEAYQSLDPLARHVLAHRWKLEAAAEVAAAAEKARAVGDVRGSRAAPPQAVNATAVRARTGATTRPIPLVGAPAARPAAAVAGVKQRPVDPKTLLPLRRPRPADDAASAPPETR
jgi:hypothetical protein